MNLSNQNQNQTTCSALFKAQDKNSNQEIFFETPKDAYEWILNHKNWVLKKREIVKWSFPLEQTVMQECWVRVDS